ncbi:MAG: hypothetical protein ACUVTO_00610 [Candidatus Caldatribacteriaceae bacterium]
MQWWVVGFLFFVVFAGWIGGGTQSFAFDVALSELGEIPRLETSPFVGIAPDRGHFGTYRPGENVVLSLFSERDGYVSVFDYTPDGKARIVRDNDFLVAGSRREVYVSVAGPEGIERFVMVLVPWVVPEDLLIEAMQYPGQIQRILGEGVLLQHCAIQVVRERTLASSFIYFDRVPQEVASQSKVKVAVNLSDEVGNVLVNRRIRWEVSDGKLDEQQTFTNTFGRSEVWYTAPTPQEDREVVIRARFEGDVVYGPSEAEVCFVVRTDRLMTMLELSPKVFRVSAGEVVDFEATLLDVRGRPVEGGTICWLASGGSLERSETLTDERGKTANRFFAPRIEAQESIEIRAVFEGTKRFLPSEGYAAGMVSGTEIFAGESFYFLDFSVGQVKTNFEDLDYRGALEKGFFENPVFALLLGKGDFVEVAFSLSQPLQQGALYFWGKARGECLLRVYVNGQLSFSEKIQDEKGGPLDARAISLEPFMELGKNALRFEVEPVRKGAYYILQRVLVVF